MSTPTPGKLLTIYLGDADRLGGRSLAEVIVERAREDGLAGATVLRGIEGFGPDSRLRIAHLLPAGENVPVVIQIVDEARLVDAFLPRLERLLGGGVATTEDVAFTVHSDRPPAYPLDDG